MYVDPFVNMRLDFGKYRLACDKPCKGLLMDSFFMLEISVIGASMDESVRRSFDSLRALQTPYANRIEP